MCEVILCIIHTLFSFFVITEMPTPTMHILSCFDWLNYQIPKFMCVSIKEDGPFPTLRTRADYCTHSCGFIVILFSLLWSSLRFLILCHEVPYCLMNHTFIYFRGSYPHDGLAWIYHLGLKLAWL